MSKNQQVKMKKEIWKSVKGFENYKVSNLSRVKSTMGKEERILTPVVQSGRSYIRMSKDKKSVKLPLEQVRKEAFSNKK